VVGLKASGVLCMFSNLDDAVRLTRREIAPDMRELARTKIRIGNLEHDHCGETALSLSRHSLDLNSAQ